MGIFAITLIAVIAAVILWFFAPTIFTDDSPEGEYQILLTVNGQQLTATIENTPASYALRRILERGSKAVSMRDYGSMEKVGMLWRRLPTSDQNIVTQPGDIILIWVAQLSFIMIRMPGVLQSLGISIMCRKTS